MANLEEKIMKADFQGVLITAIITGLAFVVGLFWRDAITETINKIVPQGDGLLFRYSSAIIATIVVVLIAYVLVKIQQIRIEEIQKQRKKRKR